MAVKGGALDVRVEAPSFRELFGKSSQVDRKLKAALRRNIRKAAGEVADDMRSEVGDGAAGGLRSGIRSGIKVDIMTGTNRREGVRIRSTGPLAAAWEARGGWRHPVFGGDVWVHQQGRPYFLSSVAKGQDKVRASVEAAMREAVESL